jgi:hypothetical protein
MQGGIVMMDGISSPSFTLVEQVGACLLLSEPVR